MKPYIFAAASFSHDGNYRFSLSRTWDDSRPSVTWIMCNPSTASVIRDDPTVRKCVAISNANGYGALTVVNLFAKCATDPRELTRVEDPEGRENFEHVFRTPPGSDVVAAWGNSVFRAGVERSSVAQNFQSFMRHRRILHLGLTKLKQPRHPLYVAINTPLSELSFVAVK